MTGIIIKAQIKRDPITGYSGVCKALNVEVENETFEGCRYQLGNKIVDAFTEKYSGGRRVEIKEEVGCNINFEIIPAVNSTFDDFCDCESEIPDDCGPVEIKTNELTGDIISELPPGESGVTTDAETSDEPFMDYEEEEIIPDDATFTESDRREGRS